MKKSVGKNGQFVHFELEAEPGRQVFVAGTFNGWNPTANPMMDNPDSGHYKAALKLPPGRHEYKFVVNGAWRKDLKCSVCVEKSHGYVNSVINI